MGKHDWMTRSKSKSRYARRFNPSFSDDSAAPTGADRFDGDTSADDEGPPAPRTRWRIGTAAVCVAAGLAASLVLTLWIGGAFGNPARNVTEIRSQSTAGAGPSTTGPAGLEETAKPSPQASAPDLAPASVRAPSSSSGAASQASRLIVHVAGAVNDPGIVRLDPGSRVHQAIAEAGGATDEAQLDAVNLAAEVEDGQQLYVPTPAEASAAPMQGPAVGGAGGPAGAAEAGTSSGGAGAGEETPLVNVNTATAEQLSALPGVGPVLSGRIVEWRQEHGAFTTVDELDAVSGIGEKMLATLRELVTL